MDRRAFIKYAGLTGIVACLPIYGKQVKHFISNRAQDNKRIIYVFLNGGMDALSVLFPKEEFASLQKYRKNLLFNPDSAAEFGNYLGHPALKTIQPLWKSGKMNFCHQSGFKGNKSHAEDKEFAQTFSTNEGHPSLIEALLPSLSRANELIYCTSTYPPFISPLHPAAMLGNNLTESIKMYKNWETESGFTEAQIHQLQEIVRTNIELNKLTSPPQINTEKNSFELVGDLILGNYPFRLAYIEEGGWDHHAGQGVIGGDFDSKLNFVMRSLSNLVKSIGPKIDDTLIVVTSEFGRRIIGNGSSGSEHGSGGLTFLIGGNQQSAPNLTRWENLAQLNPTPNTDLPVTTDIRDIWYDITTNYLNHNLPLDFFENYKVKKMAQPIFKKT